MAGLCGTSAAQPQLLPVQTFEASWTHLGGGAQRSCAVDLPSPPFNSPRWVVDHDNNGYEISFLGQAGIAVYAGERANDGLVFAAGALDSEIDGTPSPMTIYKLFAISRSTGLVVWSAVIDEPLLDSSSSPAIDERNRVVFYGSGHHLRAFNIADGTPAWTITLDREIVNASPLIVWEPGSPGRLLITDYDGFPYNGNCAHVYCINTDAFDALRNPYTPGSVVWSTCIGASSGNSVSYLPRSLGGTGLVYVASIGQYGQEPGHIYAFSLFPSDPQNVSPVWTFTNSLMLGYFGGVCIAPSAPGLLPRGNPSIYAASYAFFGGTDSANLVKINAVNGQRIWSTPSNRSSSIPIPIPGGFVALAAGYDSSSIAMVELFQDFGASARLVWDTSGVISAGGWSNQPVLAKFGGKNLLASGSPPSTFSNPWKWSPTLYLLDMSRSPDQGGFVVQQYDGVGGSPAIVGASLYCVGAIGLAAFGPTPSDLDLSGDGLINIDDLMAWERGIGSRDINLDGIVDSRDKAVLMTSLRAMEASALRGDRR